LAENLVQVHGDIFVSKCRSCGFNTSDREAHTESLPRCPTCSEHLSPGVVWFGEELPHRQLVRVGQYLVGGPCSLVLVIGTTAQFGYITEWALRSKSRSGLLVEINPEPVLMGMADYVIRERAAIALPELIALIGS
jgi:NAD-dependent deacetylase